ncbi:DTW domain-containing protein YfiP [Sinobacterium caligoides]|uniref:tRNA-uridine aminocarboxypropyltransferase n=1 Tax=Sinobacterium caligoides TaxID=933926 RepID=A0A3N2DYR6_9GAMM|nr:tRNA-uridine aminocarboxypropyltransferase [Sinobacterium caligoides]ROS04822.1 DTW domain-containing protein YfiP [Sinobacterium caligoides]
MSKTPQKDTRAHCERCLRPASVCLCHLICKINNDIKVTIYRHPSETNKAVGTASLAHLCLENSSIIDTEVVKQVTHAQETLQVLVFPPLEAEATSSIVLNTSALAALLNDRPIELIFLDGTWKKARKMYYLSPDLHQLPKLNLDLSGITAHYTIRKAEKSGQLSTLEAIAAALSQCEQNTEKYLPLLTLQQGMVDQQLAAMDKKVRLRYE